MDDLTMILARASSLIVAVIVCAWFALGIRQAHDTNAALSIVSQSTPVSATQLVHADALLRSAGKLNPDATVDLLRGKVALLRNDSRRAALIFEHVTRSEPSNLEAWLLLASAAYGNGPLIESATANLARLDPRGTQRP